MFVFVKNNFFSFSSSIVEVKLEARVRNESNNDGGSGIGGKNSCIGGGIGSGGGGSCFITGSCLITLVR